MEWRDQRKYSISMHAHSIFHYQSGKPGLFCEALIAVRITIFDLLVQVYIDI
jgi:hypothetical protein